LRQIDDASLEQQETKRATSIKEGVRVGNLVVLAHPTREALDQYKQQLLSKSYQIDETEHFVTCRQPSTNKLILMHLFKPEEANADLICFIEDELPTSGIIPTSRAFGATLFAILASMYSAPRNQQTIWLNFCLNSLNSLRDQIAHPQQSTLAKVSYISPFAAIYRRIFELITGQSLLDVGCSFGFLPVLVSERKPTMHVTGCDISADAIGFSSSLANAVKAQNTMLTQRDVLSKDFPELGRFDTVTAIHLLEHLAEEDMPTALDHLLQATRKRLLIAVPYEEQAHKVYGHEQVFTPAKLHQWGNWCIEAIGGKGKYWYEELMGGLLVVECSRQMY
jgi:SAM-dependent methyltransferase